MVSKRIDDITIVYSLVKDSTRQVQLFREILFYSSILFNSQTSHHTACHSTERNQRLLNALQHSSSSFAQSVFQTNTLEPIVIITPELGKWSTVGGLGVMVDNLSKALANQGQEVIVISPYYDRNRYGEVE